MGTTKEIVEQAAEWLVRLEDSPDEATREAFVYWALQSPDHVREVLLMCALDYEVQRLLYKGLTT